MTKPGGTYRKKGKKKHTRRPKIIRGHNVGQGGNKPTDRRRKSWEG